MASPLEIKKLLLDLSAAYSDWRPPDMKSTLEQYERSLARYPLELLEQAMDRCRDTCLFFPKIAEIRKAANELNTPTPETVRDVPPKKVTSPEIQAMLDDFRRHMVDSGKWNEAHRENRFNHRKPRIF